MECLLLICAKYLRKNRDKAWTAITCAIISTLLIVIILEISNGTSKYLIDKYAVLGDDFLLIETEEYNADLYDYLANCDAEKLNVSAYTTSLIDINENTLLIENIIATDNEKKSLIESEYTENQLIHGRFFNSYEKQEGDKVAIIESSIAQAMFGTDLVIGESISIYESEYRIVGVTKKEKESGTYYVEEDNTDRVYGKVFIPMSSLSDSYRETMMASYHVTGTTEFVRNLASKAVKHMESRGYSYTITDSIEIENSVVRIVSTIRLILIGVSIFSIVMAFLILNNSVRLTLLDLKKTIIYFKALGIKEEKVISMGTYIAILIMVTGSLIGIAVGVIAQLFFNIVLDLPIYITKTEIFVILVADIIISIISSKCTKGFWKKIQVMDLFRN